MVSASFRPDTSLLVQLTIALFILAGCSKGERIVSIDTRNENGNSITWITFADNTSIRKSGSKVIINYSLRIVADDLQRQKDLFKSQYGYDGLTVVTGYSGTIQFDCDSKTFRDIELSSTLSDGRQKNVAFESGIVIPNSHHEKLMQYACMTSYWRPIYDLWHGANSPL